jgi:selenide,water dikinase
MYRKGEGTGSNLPNRLMVHESLDWQVRLSKPEEQILFDPQTSGGLVLSVPGSEADALVSALEAAGVPTAVRVGEVLAGRPTLEIV